MHALSRLALWFALLLGTACASRGVAPPAAPEGSRTTPSRVELERTLVTPEDAASVYEWRQRARRLRAAGDVRAAAAALDRIHRLDASGPLAAEALFEAGIAWDDVGELEQATLRFERLVRLYPESPLAREARFRALRLLTYRERWQAAGVMAEEILRLYSGELLPFEAVATHGARALALVAAGDERGAMVHVERARHLIELHGLDTAGRVHRDLAPTYFALGEVRRLRGERIRFDPRPADFAAALEARCQLLLDAQAAYSDAMRAYDARWSAMAGFRVGELYQRLHEDLMRIPPPPAADRASSQALFDGAMRLRYSVLLAKGLGMMEHVLAMARRTGERSAWVERAEDARDRLLAARRAEEEALARLPYSRAELQAALDRLASSSP